MELESSLLYLRLALALPLKYLPLAHRLLGKILGVIMMTVIVIVIKRNEMLHHKNVHSDLGSEIYNVDHIGLIFAALIALTSKAAGGLVTVFNGNDIPHWNKLAVNAGHQPTASVPTEVFVYREKHAPRVIPRYYTALIVGIYVYDIVKLGVLGIRHVKA